MNTQNQAKSVGFQCPACRGVLNYIPNRAAPFCELCGFKIFHSENNSSRKIDRILRPLFEWFFRRGLNIMQILIFKLPQKIAMNRRKRKTEKNTGPRYRVVTGDEKLRVAQMDKLFAGFDWAGFIRRHGFSIERLKHLF